MLMVYFFLELDLNEQAVSDAIGGIVLALLNLMILWLFVEAVLGIRKRFFTEEKTKKKKVSNSNSLKNSRREETLQ